MTPMPTDTSAPELLDFARRFVRETLGCGCPEELLERIEIRRLHAPEPVTELRVGGRLLVHLRPRPTESGLDDALTRWLDEGVELRDSLAYNRFRLVLIGPEPGPEPVAAESALAAPGVDERTHLHLVSPTQAGPLAPPET